MHRMTPNWTWTLSSLKYSIYTICLSPMTKFGPFFSTICRFRDTTFSRSAKSKMHRMTAHWTWTLNSQRYSFTDDGLPRDDSSSAVAQSRAKHITVYFIYFFLAQDHMGLKVSQCCCFYSFHQISAKLYEDIGCHSGIQTITFLGNRPGFKNFAAL